MNKLTYEEWKLKYINIDPQLVHAMQKVHGDDAFTEIDKLVKWDYEYYLSGGYLNVDGIEELPE